MPEVEGVSIADTGKEAAAHPARGHKRTSPDVDAEAPGAEEASTAAPMAAAAAGGAHAAAATYASLTEVRMRRRCIAPQGI